MDIQLHPRLLPFYAYAAHGPKRPAHPCAGRAKQAELFGQSMVDRWPQMVDWWRENGRLSRCHAGNAKRASSLDF
ncbi:MAG: hypothetical protein WBE48_23075 [Xanthobacteraceae bacterium]